MNNLFKNNRKLFIAFALILLIVVMGIRFEWFSVGGALKSTLGSAKKGRLLQRVTIAGVIVPQKRAIITGPFNGYVQKIYVKTGDIVKKGDPLVTVTQTLQSNEETFPIRAPFAGKVVYIQKSEGENVKENDLTDYILRVDDLSKLFVEANAPEIERVKIAKNQAVEIKATAILDRTYKGLIREMALSAKETEKWSRSAQVVFPVRVEITNFDDQLYPGMSVVMDIVTGRKDNVLMLRHEFLQREDGEFFVLLKNNSKRIIKVGLQNEEVIEVVDGLREGELVKQVDFANLVSPDRR